MLKPGAKRPSRARVPFQSAPTPSDPRHFLPGKPTLRLSGSKPTSPAASAQPASICLNHSGELGPPSCAGAAIPALTFFRRLCEESCRLERQPEPKMVRTDAGQWTDTSRCSPSKMRRTLAAPITRTVGRPNR